jgi:predicted secreted protein
MALSLFPVSATAMSKKKTESETQTGVKSSSASETVWVVRPSQGTQCSIEAQGSLEKSSADLKAAGVQVLEMQKKTDGKMRMALCGSPTGKSDALKINQSDLAKAQAIGFQVDQVQ